MAKKVLLIVLVVLLAVSFAVTAQKKELVHYHWTETNYDVVNKKAVDTFMAQNPNVRVVVLYLPDSDRREHHPHRAGGQAARSIPSP